MLSEDGIVVSNVLQRTLNYLQVQFAANCGRTEANRMVAVEAETGDCERTNKMSIQVYERNCILVTSAKQYPNGTNSRANTFGQFFNFLEQKVAVAMTQAKVTTSTSRWCSERLSFSLFPASAPFWLSNHLGLREPARWG